jgi:hypothetical protein
MTIVVGLLAAIGIFVTSGRFAHIDHEHDWERERPNPGHTHEGFWAELHDGCAAEPVCMAERLLEHDNGPQHLARQLSSDEPVDREEAIEVAAHFGEGRGLDLIADAVPAEPDPLLRLREVTVLVEAGDRRGLDLAIDLLEADSPPLVRDEAHQLLLHRAEEDFGYDAFATTADNADAIAAWRRWADSRH